MTGRHDEAIFYSSLKTARSPKEEDNTTWKLKFIITKTRLYNFDPLKSHFYIVKLGFTGVYIIFSYFC